MRLENEGLYVLPLCLKLSFADVNEYLMLNINNLLIHFWDLESVCSRYRLH